MTVREFFWPILEEPNEAESANIAAQEGVDLEKIRTAPITTDVDGLVVEAQRLGDAETDRRKGAEARATTYLAVVGVLAPILATLTPTALNASGDIVRMGITLALFSAAGAYLLWCGRWAFRSLQVSVSARLDAVDLMEIWRMPDPKPHLARGLLKCVRLNRKGTNYKVSCIKMAHEFGVRAFATFVLALIVRSGWDPFLALVKAAL